MLMRRTQNTSANRTARQLMLLLCFCAIGLAQSTGAQSTGTMKQTADDDLRSIIPEKFVEKRRKKAAGVSRRRAAYKRVTSDVSEPKGRSQNTPIQPPRPGANQYAQLGLTIWRL